MPDKPNIASLVSKPAASAASLFRGSGGRNWGELEERVDIEGGEYGAYIPNLDSHSDSSMLPTAIVLVLSHFSQQLRDVAD